MKNVEFVERPYIYKFMLAYNIGYLNVFKMDALFTFILGQITMAYAVDTCYFQLVSPFLIFLSSIMDDS